MENNTSHPQPIATYGEPGGVYLALHLDFERNVYYLLNEDGVELVNDPFESEVRAYAEAILIAEGAA